MHNFTKQIGGSVGTTKDVYEEWAGTPESRAAKACPPGHCRTPSAPCRDRCIQIIQPRDTKDEPTPVGVREVPHG